MIEFSLGITGKLKTLLDRLTASRAANMDNCDATISTRSTAVNLAIVDTNVDQIESRVNLIPTNPLTTAVRGRAYARVTLQNSTEYVDIPISARVNIDKCLVVVGGGSNEPQHATAQYGYLTSTTNVRVYVYNGGTTYSKRVGCYVIEYY